MANPLAYDRYAYVRNNPVTYNDPTGHWVDDGCSTEGCTGDSSAIVINKRIKNYDGTYKWSKYVFDLPFEAYTARQYFYPLQPDYRSFSIYFGQFGSLTTFLIGQLEPTPFAELAAPAAGMFLSGGFTITVDKYGRLFITPAASIGRTMVSYQLLGAPSVSFMYGYIERGETFGLEGNASKEELNNLLSGWGRNHGVCGPIFPCINRAYSLTSSTNAWEWGFGTPQLNIFTLGFGIK